LQWLPVLAGELVSFRHLSLSHFANLSRGGDIASRSTSYDCMGDGLGPRRTGWNADNLCHFTRNGFGK
jgi:hypothetical protein